MSDTTEEAAWKNKHAEFVRHAATLIYAAELPRALERARGNGYAASKPFFDTMSRQSVEAAMSLATALDAAGFTGT